jgi:hypothetical protein
MANTRFYLDANVWTTAYAADLTLEEHGMYTLLGSQKMLSLCGVLHYSPKRLAKLTRGATVESVERVIAGLEALRYVVIDRDTDELIIRTFVKNSGCLNMPKVATGMTRQFDQIASPVLRSIVLDQMIEALADPTRKLDPKPFDKRFLAALDEHRENPSPYRFETVSGTVSGTVCDTHPHTTVHCPLTTDHISGSEIAENETSVVVANAQAVGKPPTAWEASFAIASDLWPDAPEGSLKGWAGEAAKVTKKGVDPESLARLADAVMKLHGLRGVGQLSNPARSSMLARLPQLLTLNPSPKQLTERWRACSNSPKWPNEIGHRLEAVLSGWDAGDVQQRKGHSAASRMDATLTAIVETLSIDDMPNQIGAAS